MGLENEIIKIAKGAKAASGKLSMLKAGLKNAILKEMANAIRLNKALIMKANAKDLKIAKSAGLSEPLIDRLTLNDNRIEGMAKSIASVATLKDPVGMVQEVIKRPNGLVIQKVRVPIGVISVIYESRPNVTADCIALSVKSGNSLILRGGSEAINSNIAIFDILSRAALRKGLPKNSMNLVRTTDRKAVDILLGLYNLIDLVIPRGGESLIKEVTEKSKIPVIKHYKGVCHVYVDKYADLAMAESIVYNAKVQRPGVCNAMESLLVHKDIAKRFLPGMAAKLRSAGVEMRGCPITRKILRNVDIRKASESDWYEEYLDLILAIRVVPSLKEAISHINKYGTKHSDSIVSKNRTRAAEFLKMVDSSSVYWNASTRFTDGYEFGKGAEIGISTDKLHARGPMAAEELTTYKYVIFGNGQIRE